jgi:uncharacterized protein
VSVPHPTPHPSSDAVRGSDPAVTPPVTSALTRLRRKPDRGSEDRAVIDAILDAGLLCHLGYVHEGRPVVIPTLYARSGDEILVHGSSASRAMRTGAAGSPVCVTVTLLDGLVLARSANNHSANYRSVLVHGDAVEITDPQEKRRALEVLTEHVGPGRWAQVRQPDEQELRSTSVLRIALTHAVAKVRTGGVVDQERDLERAVWAGIVPFGTTLGQPEADVGLEPGLAPPDWHLAGQDTGVPLAPTSVVPG